MQLTWDETDHERLTALNRKFNKDELLDMDFRAYLASSSEEEEALSGEEPDTGGGGTGAFREGSLCGMELICSSFHRGSCQGDEEEEE